MEWTEIGKGLPLPIDGQTVYGVFSYDPDVSSYSQGKVFDAIFHTHSQYLGFFDKPHTGEKYYLRHVSHWMPRIVPEPPK